MMENKRKRLCKILFCVIVSFVIDFLFLYAEFWGMIYLACCDTFFGLFMFHNNDIENITFVIIGLLAGLVVAVACKLLKLNGKGKKIFLIVHSIVIVGFLLLWYWIMLF